VSWKTKEKGFSINGNMGEKKVSRVERKREREVGAMTDVNKLLVRSE